MRLAYFLRTVGKKGEVHRLRREGCVPAVIYGLNQPVQPIFVKQTELAANLRSVKSGTLSTVQFELHDGHKTHKALIKEVQYHRSSYAIEHIDFVLLSETTPLKVNVPIQLVGAADAVGVKLGGFVRQSIRSIRVSCLPKDIPHAFILDIHDMQIAQAKRLSDLSIPAGVKPMAKMNEVAVIIAKKA